MKTILSPVLAVACVAAFAPLHAAGDNWLTDFEAAKKQAAEEDKSLLMDFTGSDWCGWCIRLKEEVFQHDEFKKGVEDKFVLVELDFPKDKSGQSEELQAQNAELQKTYSVQGFPTILLADEAGKPFARTGYQPGGPETYVEHLDTLLEARETRDEAFAKAEDLEGTAKAEALVTALRAMGLEDELVAEFYGGVVDQIKAADPEDETGYLANLEAKKKFAEFESELQALARDQKHDEAMALTLATIDSGDFEGEMLQQVVMIKGMIHAQTGEFDAALEGLDEAKEVAPESELAGRIDMLKERLVEMKAQQTAEPEG